MEDHGSSRSQPVSGPSAPVGEAGGSAAWRHPWKFLLAYFHLSDRAVCEMSAGPREFHDWMDGPLGTPMHFHTYRCVRCSKEFTI